MKDIKKEIQDQLFSLQQGNLYDNSLRFFETLGYNTQRRNRLETPDFFGFEDRFLQKNEPFSQENALTKDWKSVELLFQLTDEEVRQSISLFQNLEVKNMLIESYLFFAIELKEAHYNRTALSKITREINRIFPMPVMVFFRYGEVVTLAMIHRRIHKKDREKDVLEKVTLLKDIRLANPHRAHLDILADLQFAQLVNTEKISNFVELHQAWQKIFDTKELNKRFYQELLDWYLFVAQHKNIKFNTKEDSEKPVLLIKLITRIIFLWFLKERKLVSAKLFDLLFLKHNLRDFEENSSSFYKGILQNLFFNVLNEKIEKRFLKYSQTEILYFQDFETVKKELNLSPFVNGGLFDATKAEIPNPNFQPEDLHIPNFLFFEGKKHQDFSQYYEGGKVTDVLGLIPLLEKYKFTIEENTPIEEEIALDPELLGKIFESLLAVYEEKKENETAKISARKATGSFYTPREIVEYMVDESLIAFLKEKAFHSENNDLIHGEKSMNNVERLQKLLSYENAENLFSETEKENIIDALDDCKILDPACGSGAFPMGILAKMTHVLAKIDPENTLWFEKLIAKFPQLIRDEMRHKLKDENWSYLRKLGIILNSIYGIDIQPVAVQIAKLRCFISLIIDQKINQNPAENYGVKALPNLEFKFVAANTLIDVPHFSEKNDPKLQQLLAKFGTATENYFYAIAEKKESVKQEIKGIISEIINYNKKIIEDTIKKNAQESNEKSKKQGSKKVILNLEGEENEPTIVAENAEKYSKKSNFRQKNIDQLANAQTLWASFENIFADKSVGFYNTDYFFPAVKAGFDIVIGNPPYIQLQKSGGELARKYEKQNYETFERSGDIYSLFYEKGTNMLAKNGLLCYITSNKWMRANYGQSTRQFFADSTQPMLLIDLGNVQVFETATVDTNILLLKKAKTASKTPKSPTQAVRLNKDFNLKTQSLMEYVQQNKYNMINLNHNAWVVGEKDLFDIKGFVEAQGIPLEKWKITINRGVLTGYNEAFIIPKEKKDELIAKDPKSAEILKPILRGKDIAAWYPKFEDLWLINTHNGIKSKNILPIDVKKDYPAVYEWLLNYETILQKRTDKGEHWTNLRNCAYIEDFEKPKIIYPNMTKYMPFVYDETDYYTNQKCFIITGQLLKYLTCFFNSRLFKYCFLDNFPELQGGTRELSKVFFEKIPVKPISAEAEAPFARIVEYLVELKQHVLTDTHDKLMEIYFEQIANALVYELYFPEAFATAKLVVNKHLQHLPTLVEDGNKLLQLRKIYVSIHQEYDPVRQAVFSMLAIPEIKLINNNL